MSGFGNANATGPVAGAHVAQPPGPGPARPRKGSFGAGGGRPRPAYHTRGGGGIGPSMGLNVRGDVTGAAARVAEKAREAIALPAIVQRKENLLAKKTAVQMQTFDPFGL